MTSKATTLAALRDRITTARIGSSVIVKRGGDWASVGRTVAERWAHKPVIVRSSAAAEDSAGRSAAGRYDSVVLPEDRHSTDVDRAIERLFASYAPASPDDEVFVQRHLDGVTHSAVVTTQTLGGLAPYWVCAIDGSSGTTDAVTAGRDEALEVWHVARHPNAIADAPTHVRRLIGVSQELETLLDHGALDIELAIDAHEVVHVFQVRPMPGHVDDERIARRNRKVIGRLARIRHQWRGGTRPAGELRSDARMYSNMTDWNPAEMIGVRPPPLAISLYRALITDTTWAEARWQYGYQDVRGIPLLHVVAGLPYIDVAASLRSLVPMTMTMAETDQIISAQMSELDGAPELHDKVEFELCAASVPVGRGPLDRLTRRGMSAEILSRLTAGAAAITRSSIARTPNDLSAMRSIGRYRSVVVSESYRASDAHRWLSEGRRAALVFAHLARAAFIATNALRCLESEGIVDGSRLDAWMRSLWTVTDQLQLDGRLVADGKLGWSQFVADYGHLRPGTYDPRTPSYGDHPEVYLAPFVTKDNAVKSLAHDRRPWDRETQPQVDEALLAARLDVDAEAFERYCRTAIAAREEGKFTFSVAIDRLLRVIQAYCREQRLDPDDAAFLTLEDVLGTQATASLLATRREEYDVTTAVHLPPFLTDPDDVLAVLTPRQRPTFVGVGRVVDRPLASVAPGDELTGVVLLPRADPGFEWLFAHKPRGLVTMLGGANSHMAVRCAELGVPAAVGVGELVFGELTRAARVELDAGAQIIRPM